MTNEEIIGHLDEILADLADERAELHQTTVGYKSDPKGCKHTWTIPPSGTHWSNAELSHDAATIKLEDLKSALGEPAPVNARVFSRVAFNRDNAANNAGRYSHVVVGMAEGSRLIPDIFRDLMAAGTKGLLYKNALNIGYGANTLSGSDYRVPYAVSKTEGQAWTTGQAWNNGWMADLGNPDYQAKWAENAALAADAAGAEGIFIDDLKWKDVPLPAGWTQAMVQAKTLSFIKAVSAQIWDHLLLVGNIGSACASDFIDTLPSWYAYLDGWMDEGIGRANVSHTGTLDGKDWINNRIKAIKQSEARGKVFLGSIPCDAGDTKTIRWGLAEYLLSATRRDISTIGLATTKDSANTYFGSENWTAECDAALAKGEPTGLAIWTGTKFTRAFQSGALLTADPATFVVTGF